MKGRHWLLDDRERTENALATRFIDTFGDELRYVPKWNKWLVWDGKRFSIDDGNSLVLGKTRQFAKRLWMDFGAAGRVGASRDECERALAFVRSANKSRGIRSFIELATADDRVRINHESLNANGHLLNVQNGTYNAGSDEFREHRRDDLLTQIAEVRYDDAADCPQWDKALQLIFQGDADLIRYVRALLGYSLIGECAEHVLPIAYGSGCNGKSFLWNAIVELAGDYALVANDSLLLGERNAHATEKASLYQKRIVAISEPEQGARMREARIKELTGDSFITARRMREDFWTFRRTHTFWLSTNHLPKVSGNDEGIWRRLKVIPFAVDLRRVTKPIPDFHRIVVEQEGPGILNWLLSGFRDYRQNKLIEPAAVKRLGQEYRAEEDHLMQFISDCCTISPHGIVRGSDFYQAYRTWGGNLSNVAFAREISRRFHKEKPTSGKHRNSIIYQGITLLSEGM